VKPSESKSGPLHAFWRLKPMRESRGITLEDLAKRSGLTKSFISKVERGVSTPSIGSAIKLADAFGVGIGDLFGAEGAEADFRVVRRTERQPFNRRGQSSGHRYEAIALAHPRGLFEAFVDLPPFAVPPSHRPAEHRGQEMVYVLKGKAAVHFPHTTLHLATGDSLLFNGRLPHFMLSVPPHQAELLIVVTDPGEGSAPAAPEPPPPRPAKTSRPAKAPRG
jgi:transcriptional regulator with XRE-family HTH domain